MDKQDRHIQSTDNVRSEVVGAQTSEESLQQPLKSAVMAPSTCRCFASFTHTVPPISGNRTCNTNVGSDQHTMLTHGQKIVS